MAFPDLQITEIFHSIQGETSHSGLRYAFIRLTGCNLRCTYCDSTYAFKGGKRMTFDEVLSAIEPFQVSHVLLTGGEPLLQRNTLPLIHRLRDAGYSVSIETHGEVSIQAASPLARIVMDIKTPSSGMCRGGFEKNFQFLKPSDEIKFVLGTPEDFEFARTWIESGKLPAVQEILLSPVHSDSSLDLRWVAEKMIEHRLPARLQTQLHKQVWGRERTGV